MTPLSIVLILAASAVIGLVVGIFFSFLSRRLEEKLYQKRKAIDIAERERMGLPQRIDWR